jgi:hypothetical protein
MSDEYDTWLENALGVDVSSYVGGVTIDPSASSGQYATGLDIPPDPPGGYATGLDIDPNASGGPPYYALGENGPPDMPDIDAGNFAASLTGVADDAGAANATGAVIAEDDIPYVLGETAIEEVETEPDDGSGETSETAGKPTISVTANGEDFKISGSGFLPNANVAIRGRQHGDGWAKELPYFEARSDSEGRIDCEVTGSFMCRAPGEIRFSATNGQANQSDISRVLWSDDVNAVCLVPKNEKDDDSDEPSDKPDDNGDDPPAHGTIGVTIENADLAHDVFLTVRDLNLNGQIIVSGEKLPANTRRPLKITADKDGRGKIHWAAVQVDSPAGTQPKEDTVERITAGQNISTGLH